MLGGGGLCAGIILKLILKRENVDVVVLIHVHQGNSSMARPLASPTVLYCGRVPAVNAPGCTAAEGLLHKPWSLVVPTHTARCLHQRP